MNKQRNMIIKPLRVENSNKLLNKIFPDGKKSQNVKSSVQIEEQQVTESVKQITNVEQEEYDYSDDYSDTSSVSSCESDQREINIWDNSELRLRAINIEDFSDYYGKKLSFLQLYKIRSFFYTKGIQPQLGDIFKDAEKIHKFCRMQLNLDDFLEEEAQYNLIDVDQTKDKNFARFSRYFEQQLEFNSQKMRDEFYDRYSCVDFQAFQSPQQSSVSPQKRNSTFVRNGQRMISGLNLSPRKPPAKKRLITEFNQQKNGQDQVVRKSQLNLLQLSEMQRKQKLQMSQQKFMQDNQAQFRVQSNEDDIKQKLLIADLEMQDNFVSTSESNNQMSNSSCGSQQDCQQKLNNNPTNQINLKLTGSSNAQSPIQSPISNGSFKRGSPNGSQKSPLISEQNQFRLKLCNTRDFDESQSNPNGHVDSRKVSQFNKNSTITNSKQTTNQKNETLSSFTKFLSSSQSPKKRVIPNSVNASPVIKASHKQNYDFNGIVRQSQNNVLNSTQFKKTQNNYNSQQQPIQSEYFFNGKNNSNNTSIKELKLPNIGAGLKDKKASIQHSPESPVRNSQLYHQNQIYSQSGSPNLIQSPILKPQSPYPQSSTIIQQTYQRTHKKFQSTIFGEESRKQYQQLLSTKM